MTTNLNREVYIPQITGVAEAVEKMLFEAIIDCPCCKNRAQKVYVEKLGFDVRYPYWICCTRCDHAFKFTGTIKKDCGRYETYLLVRQGE